jgi:DNA helicase-2/ATP-dependent DNA helicase PcrA
LRPLVRARYADAPARLEDLERLVGGVSVVDDLATWLADLTLDPPASTGDLAGEPHLDEDYVVISTIHSAKGLEWPIVHLPHMVDGAIPSDMALKSLDGLDEERRLLYVAVTRARDELHLYAPLRMPHHRGASDDRHSLAPLSRFIDETVQSTLEIVEESPRGFKVAGSSAEKVIVNLDALWA